MRSKQYRERERERRLTYSVFFFVLRPCTNDQRPCTNDDSRGTYNAFNLLAIETLDDRSYLCQDKKDWIYPRDENAPLHTNESPPMACVPNISNFTTVPVVIGGTVVLLQGSSTSTSTSHTNTNTIITTSRIQNNIKSKSTRRHGQIPFHQTRSAAPFY